MDKGRKLIIAGNWKMNKTVAEALDLVNGLKRDLGNIKEIDIVVCPPFTALSDVSKAILNTNIRLGAQNMSEHNFGAYTGEIAAGMLKEFSVRYVILGHSERRQYQKETDELIAKKALAAHAASRCASVSPTQTIWAIGTGKNATADQAQDAHMFIRKQLAAMFNETVARHARIQYGGSVKPSNARELMSQRDVDGALVGGASLEDRNFSDIIKNCVN